jgi:hypothetical protein
VTIGKQPFPYLITEIDEIDFRVTAIIKSQVNFWKWPASNVEIWYSKDNILRRTKAPLQITKTKFIVPEIFIGTRFSCPKLIPQEGDIVPWELLTRFTLG